jgi:phage shock protein A
MRGEPAAADELLHALQQREQAAASLQASVAQLQQQLHEAKSEAAELQQQLQDSSASLHLVSLMCRTVRMSWL